MESDNNLSLTFQVETSQQVKEFAITENNPDDLNRALNEGHHFTLKTSHVLTLWGVSFQRGDHFSPEAFTS